MAAVKVLAMMAALAVSRGAEEEQSRAVLGWAETLEELVASRGEVGVLVAVLVAGSVAVLVAAREEAR